MPISTSSRKETLSFIRPNFTPEMTSFISFIVSVPITLYNFYEINLLSIFYNLFYVPFVSIIVFPLSIITFLFPIIEPIFQFFIYILESSSLYISHFDILQFIFIYI